MGLKKAVTYILTGLIFALGAVAVNAAELKLPESVKAGDLFVISLLPASNDKQVNLKFNSSELQFMGAVQGTPDIQINSDGEITIRPEGGAFAAVYELKFLSLISSGSSNIAMTDAAGSRPVALVVSVPEVERTYSWLILAAAVVLLVAGLKIWRYQKSAPAMMSTKSLFMSYEELEKARKMYFPDEPVSSPPVSSQPANASAVDPDNAADVADQKKDGNIPAPASSSATVTNGAAVSNAKPSAGKATLKEMPAAGPSEQSKEHLKKRLAMVFSSDQHAPVVVDKPVQPASPSKPAEPQVAAVEKEPAKPSPAVEEKPTVPVSAQPVAGALDSTGQRPGAVKVSPPAGGLKVVPAAEKMVFAIEDSSGRPYEATGPLIKIGRRKDNQICITASEISREHVEVTIDQGRVFVRALTESNVTRLNDRTVKEKMQVKPGDKLNMGGTDFIVTKARPA